MTPGEGPQQSDPTQLAGPYARSDVRWYESILPNGTTVVDYPRIPGSGSAYLAAAGRWMTVVKGDPGSRVLAFSILIVTAVVAMGTRVAVALSIDRLIALPVALVISGVIIAIWLRNLPEERRGGIAVSTCVVPESTGFVAMEAATRASLAQLRVEVRKEGRKNGVLTLKLALPMTLWIAPAMGDSPSGIVLRTVGRENVELHRRLKGLILLSLGLPRIQESNEASPTRSSE